MDWTLAVVVAAAAAALNNALHAAPDTHRSVVVNLGVAVAGVAAATWVVVRGDPWAGVTAGLAWTAVTAVVLGVVAIVATRVPRVAAALADERMAAMPRAAFTRHVTLRIPLLSALAEEVLFRGVVWGLLERAGGTGTALLGSAVAFAVSHAVVGAQQAEAQGRDRGRWVLVTLAATFVAGLALGGLRWATGGVWASTGVHATVNVCLALLARRHGVAASSSAGTPKSEA